MHSSLGELEQSAQHLTEGAHAIKHRSVKTDGKRVRPCRPTLGNIARRMMIVLGLLVVLTVPSARSADTNVTIETTVTGPGNDSTFIISIRDIPVLLIRDRDCFPSRYERALHVRHQLELGLRRLDSALRQPPHAIVAYSPDACSQCRSIELMGVPIVRVNDSDAVHFAENISVVRRRFAHYTMHPDGRWCFRRKYSHVTIRVGASPSVLLRYWLCLLADATLISHGSEPMALNTVPATQVLRDVSAMRDSTGDIPQWYLRSSDVRQRLDSLVLRLPKEFGTRISDVPRIVVSCDSCHESRRPDTPGNTPPIVPPPMRLDLSGQGLLDSLAVGFVRWSEPPTPNLLVIAGITLLGVLAYVLWRRLRVRPPKPLPLRFDLRAVGGASVARAVEGIHVPIGGALYLNGDHSDLSFDVGSSWRIQNDPGGLKLVDEHGKVHRELKNGMRFPVESKFGPVELDISNIVQETS